MLADDGNGVATSLAVVATLDADNATWNDVNSAADALKAEDPSELVMYVSYIKAIKKTSNGINITLGNDEVVTVKGSANAYTFYQRTTTKASIVAGDWMGAPSIDATGVGVDGGDNKSTNCLVIVENGVVTDIITHSTRK